MRVIVIGLGEVGQNVVATLSAENHDVIVIDNDEQRVIALQDQVDALVVHGNGASPKFLESMDAANTDLLVAATQTDEVNVIAALAAKQLGTERTVARVRDSEYFGADVAFSRDVMGIDFVIHTERATAEEILGAIMLPGAVHVEHYADGRLALAESIIGPRSPIAGQRLQDRDVKYPQFIVGIIRDGVPKIASGDDVVEVGDHVLLAASRKNIAPAVARISGTAQKVHDVVLFGGGKIGIHLARLLVKSGCRVKIMERDRERARFVAERLPRAIVLHEEGVGQDTFRMHSVDEADAFVACAGDDRANLLSALYAKQVGADLCLSVVSREEFVPLVSALKIDAAFSPRLITAGAIMRFVRSGPVQSLHLMLAGSEVLELEVSPTAKLRGRSLRDPGLPKEARVAAAVRGEKVLLPLNDHRIEPGDRILVFGLSGCAAEVERAFRG